MLIIFIASLPKGASVWALVDDGVFGAKFEHEFTADPLANTQFLRPRLYLNSGTMAAVADCDCPKVNIETDS